MLNDRLRWSIKTHPHRICGRQRSKPAPLSPSVAGPVSSRRLRDITGLVKVGNHGVGLPQRGNYPRQAWLESGRLLKRREDSFQAVKEPVARVEGKPQAWLAGSLQELRGASSDMQQRCTGQSRVTLPNMDRLGDQDSRRPRVYALEGLQQWGGLSRTKPRPRPNNMLRRKRMWLEAMKFVVTRHTAIRALK